MPLDPTTLDNTYPPIWLQDYSTDKEVGGVAVADLEGVYDENTEYRRVNGEDPQNYWTQQRQGGDLFHRDLVIEEEIRRVINYLGQRCGHTFHIPTVIIAPEHYVTIASIGDAFTSLTAHTGWFVSACRVKKTTDSGNCGLRIVDGSRTVVWTSTAYGNSTSIYTTGALATGSRGEVINSTDGSDLSVEVFNDHATNNAVLSAMAVLAPKTV